MKPIQQSPQGNFIQADYFDNSGGVNPTDSPFRLQDTQAASGYCYDYTTLGAIQKRFGHTLLSQSPDAQVRTLGLGMYADLSNNKTLLRAAGSKAQTVNASTFACTNLADDTAGAGSTFFSGTSQVPMRQFTGALATVMWMTGGGLGAVTGYNGTKMTVNGSKAPTGVIAASQAGSSGTWIATGTFYYSASLRKKSTQAESNVALDVGIALSATTHTITLDLTGLTSLDLTKYDQINIYRSGLNGVSGFTTGDLIAQLATTATTYADNSSYIATAVNVPRTGNIVLDNSMLPTGTYKTLAVWKRRLVTSLGSTLYISDLDKSESWPLGNNLIIPTGGPITAIMSVSYSSSWSSATVDEFLVVFKERELWIVTGNNVSDWSLIFVDTVGCLSQSCPVIANGFLFWVDYRGVYLWDGTGKPIYCSRLIEQLFSTNGDLNLANLGEICGTFFRKKNQIVWYVSSDSLGEQAMALKLDARLTLPAMTYSASQGRILEGVFMLDTQGFPVYACQAALPSFSEVFYGADGAGNIWSLFNNLNSDNGAAIPFVYRSKTQDFGSFGITKRFHKVVVWCYTTTAAAQLQMNYWFGYQTDNSKQFTQTATIPVAQNNSATWDATSPTWDSAIWDSLSASFFPVVFEINSLSREGDAFTVEFQQQGLNVPLVIAGYSVIYSTLGIRKETVGVSA